MRRLHVSLAIRPLTLKQRFRLRHHTIDALIEMIDERDPYTASHSRRVAAYARELSTALGLSSDEINLIERAARLHDIGKLGVDQVVLCKASQLDPAEWQSLEKHPITGAEILNRYPLLTRASSYVRHHHEAVDGSGYPDRIAGDAIPLGARIIAVADAFDAMANARPYRAALPPAVVLREFATRAGTQWDAKIVATLISLIEGGRITFPGTATTPQMLNQHSRFAPLPAAL